MSGLCLTRRTKFKAAEIDPEKKTGSVPCVICGHSVSRKDGVGIGHGKFRHKRCRAGSKRWLAHMKSDPFYRYFVTGTAMAVMAGEGVTMGNGIRPGTVGEQAGVFKGPELDDYLRVRAAKHSFGMAGVAIVGERDVAADGALPVGKKDCHGAL